MKMENMGIAAELAKKAMEQAAKEEAAKEKALKLESLKGELKKWEENAAKPDAYKGSPERVIVEIKKQISELENELNPKTVSKEKAEKNAAYGKEDFGPISASDLKDEFVYEGASEGFGGNDEKVERPAGDEKNVANSNEDFAVMDSEVVERGSNKINKDDIADAKNGNSIRNTEHESINEKYRENLPALRTVTPENLERTAAVTRIRQEMTDARKEYLEVNYNKNKAFDRLRKYFGNRGRDEKERGFETDMDLAHLRANYDNKLFDLQKLQIDEAREKGATDEELAKLFIEFRTEQKINLAGVHDEVKVEQQKGSLEGFVAEKIINITKAYQKLPLKMKLGVGAAMLVGGVAAGATGGAAVGFMGALAVARRLFGGVTAGVGARLALEARGQMKDRKSVNADEVRFLERLKNAATEQDKYDILSDGIKNCAIKDSENTIDRVRNQDLRQQATGVAVGTFLASGLAGKLMSMGGYKISEYFGWGNHAAVLGSAELMKSHGNEVPLSTNNFDDIKLDTPLTDSFEHPNGAPVNFAEDGKINPPVFQEALHTPTPENMSGLVIEKGSSIEGALNKFLETSHPEIKNHGATAHKMYTAYMEDYIDQHKDELAKSGKLAEYKEMLASGRVNIQPGAELKIVDFNGTPVLTEIKGDIKLLHGGIVHLGGIEKLPPVPEFNLPDPSIEDGLNHAADNHNPNIPPAPTTEDITKKVLEEHDKIEALRVKENIASSQETFGSAQRDYGKTIDKIMRGHIAESNLSSQNDALSAAEKVMGQSADYIRSTDVYRSDMKDAVKVSLGIFKENGTNLLAGNEDLEYDRAVADKELGPKLKFFRESCAKAIKANVKLHGGEYVPSLRPDDGETVKHYMQRVILRTMESKYGILRG